MENIMLFDYSVLQAIQGIRTPFLDWIMPKITTLGDIGLIWIILGVVLFIRKDTRKCGLTVLISIILGAILGEFIIKNIVQRIRPCNIDTAFQLLIARPTGYSFPSGHTCAGFACTISLMLFKNRLWVLSLVVATLIGFTRMYLYVHYPTDVLFGALLGIIASLFSVCLVKNILKSHNF